MKLHVIKGIPCNFQKDVADATEVDAMIEVETGKSSSRRGDMPKGPLRCAMAKEVKKLKADLAKTWQELKNARRILEGRIRGSSP